MTTANSTNWANEIRTLFAATVPFALEFSNHLKLSPVGQDSPRRV
jgi:hypothetical protein